MNRHTVRFGGTVYGVYLDANGEWVRYQDVVDEQHRAMEATRAFIKIQNDLLQQRDLWRGRLKFVYDDLMTKFVKPPLTFEEYVANIDTEMEKSETEK